MNVIASKPLAEGRVREVDIPNIKNINDIVAKHLQLIRSLPPRCLISTMCGMKSLQNVKTNYKEVLTREPLTIPEFLKAMEESKSPSKPKACASKKCDDKPCALLNI